MIESLFIAIRDHVFWALAIFFFAYLATNYFHHGLNRYPGPILAALTDWWRFFDVYGRRPDITHIKLHRQHGDIIRLGPNVLSFSDPQAIKQIYGLNKGFVKVNQLAFINRGGTEARHTVRVLSCPTGCNKRKEIAFTVLNY